MILAYLPQIIYIQISETARMIRIFAVSLQIEKTYELGVRGLIPLVSGSLYLYQS